MPKTKNKYLIWCAALAVIMACVPGVQAPPPAPTIDGNAIQTMIVQTGVAALSQTAAAIPTNTPTITVTATRPTNTPEPSATSTIFFRLFSPTPIGQATGTTQASNQPYACNIISVSPANGTSFKPRASFDGKWEVKNIGKKDWDSASVDYTYNNGAKIHKVESYDLKTTVKVGETIVLIVDMISPKNNGSYTTNWTMQVGTQKFCPMSLTITVNK